MYVNKFLVFTFSAYLELAGGVAYAFSLYSPALKESLGYTQLQIQSIANPLLPSLIVGVIPGFVYDSLQRHNRFGPRLALLFGGVVHIVGYTGLWLVGTHRVEKLPYLAVVAIGVIAMNGATWTDVACISANVINFPDDRGTVIGILKSMMGLSASVFATIYAVAWRPEALSFLLFIAASLPVLVLLAFPIFNAVPFRQPGELPSQNSFISNGSRFALAYAAVGALSLFMLLTTNLASVAISSRQKYSVLFGIAAILSVLLLLPLGSSGFWAKPAAEEEAAGSPEASSSSSQERPHVPTAGAGPEGLQCASASLQEHKKPLEEGLLSGGDEAEENAEGKSSTSPSATRATESLSHLNFWLLFFIFGSGAACGLLFLNNAGQLVQSLQGPEDGQDPLVTLFSVLNCFGRLLFGFLPERALHVWGTPRGVFLVATAACMAAVTAATAVAGLPLLWLTAPLCGLAYGAHWSLMPALASEIFGLSHFGLNYSLITTSATIFSYLTSNLLGGLTYEARLSAHGDKGNVCIGSDCFRTTFLVAAGMECVSLAAAALLLQRTRKLYTQDSREVVQERRVLRSPSTGHRTVPRKPLLKSSYQ